MAEILKREYILDNKAIVEITGFADSWLNEHKVQAKNRTTYMLESMLLDIVAHYDEARNIAIRIEKRLGHRFIELTYEGEAYNPVDMEDISPLTYHFLTELGFTPTWSYKNNENVLILEIPRNRIKDETYLLVAFVAAMIVGACGPLVPRVIFPFLSEFVLGTVSDIFINLLGTFAGVLIFLSILSGVCGMENVSELSKKGKYLIIRTTVIGAIGVVIGGLIAIPFFNFSFGESKGSSGIKEMYKLIMNIVPSDPVTPFAEGNMLQISFMAFIIGGIIIVLGSKVEQIKGAILQGNTVLISVVEWVCRLLPFYIFANLTLLFWKNGIGIILKAWKAIVICAVLNAVTVLLKLIYISIRYKVKGLTLLKKMSPSILIGITTASSMAAYGTTIEINEKKLGIDQRYSNFATPLKNQLHTLNGGIGVVVAVYFLAEYSGVSVDPFWFIITWIITILIHPAMPPVSGGMIVCMGIILKQCGIPDSCMGIGATLFLIFDFFGTSSKVAHVHMEEIEEASYFGVLDREILLKE